MAFFLAFGLPRFFGAGGVLSIARKASSKRAWFMAMRLRHGAASGPMGELMQGTVEVDETYVGAKKSGERARALRMPTLTKLPSSPWLNVEPAACGRFRCSASRQTTLGGRLKPT